MTTPDGHVTLDRRMYGDVTHADEPPATLIPLLEFGAASRRAGGVSEGSGRNDATTPRSVSDTDSTALYREVSTTTADAGAVTEYQANSAVPIGGPVTTTTYSGFLSALEYNSTSSLFDTGGGDGGGGAVSVVEQIIRRADETAVGDDGTRLASANDILLVNDSLNSFFYQLSSREEFRMVDIISQYVYPVIIILGNISNIMAFVALRRKKFKTSSVAFYMCAYAIANLCVLNLVLGITWLCFMLEITNPQYRADWSCRLWTFISNVITYSGIWLVVLMSVDRFVFLNLPSKATGYCTVFTGKAIVSFVLICLVVVSIHAMWTYELQPQGCWVTYAPDDLHILTWPWWSATLYSYIPLLLLLYLSVALTVSLFTRRFSKNPSRGRPPSSADDQETFVRPVFIITVAFFFLTVPSTVINLLDIHLPASLLKVDVIAKIELTKKITELLSCLNNSLPGVVLFAFSSDFRHELESALRQLFCCKRSRSLRVFEMRNISNSEDSSPHIQVDYELCNNNEENNLATDV